MYRGRPLWRCPWDRAFQLKAKAVDQGNTALFYKAVKCLKDSEAPKSWSVCDLFEMKTEAEVAEEVASFLTK